MSSDIKLKNVEFNKTGKIEDIDNALFIDFSNHFIGGGILNGGCV